MSEHDLSGKTAVVTGASSGIGRAIAEHLGAAGAHVAICGRTQSAMDATKSAIEAAGGSCTTSTTDVRDPAQVKALVDQAVADTGRLDIMVNNAGLSHPEPILSADPEGWREMLETNVLGLLVGCQAAVAAMRACGATGHVVNISSVAALNPASGVYGSTKHAVNTIGNSLRQELMDDPIQVVTIMPGAIATNFARNFDPEIVKGVAAMSGVGEGVEVKKGERLPDDVLAGAQSALSDVLAGPDDVADAVMFAVTRPAAVHMAEIVVRPNKDLSL